MPLPAHPLLFDAYFVSGHLPCPKCGAEFDLWKTVREMVRLAFPTSALLLAGAETKLFTIKLAVDETKEVTFSDYGVPSDAEIVHLNLTSNGSALPNLQHGNEPFSSPLPNKIVVRGQRAGEQPGDGPLAVSVTWFAPGPEDNSVRHLVEAARSYEAKRFDAVIVPANIAVEAKLSPVVSAALAGFCGKSRLRNFMDNAATYGHQLNVLVPVIAALVEAPRLSMDIVGILNRLRGLRNDVVHSGSCKEQTQRDGADHIAAALFGIRYSVLLGKYVEAAKQAGKL